MHTIVELPLFSRYAPDYFDDSELVQLQTYLAAHPTAGDVVPATGGVRKLRWSQPGMGKRGGLRILYYVQEAKGRNGLREECAREHCGGHPQHPQRDR